MDNIYNEDYKTGFSKLEDKSIDLIVTDPPYLHVKGGMKSKRFNGTNSTWGKESAMVNDLSDFGKKEINEFLDIAIKKMKKVNMFIFCSKLQLQYYFSYIESHKLKYDLLVWDKEKHSLKSTKFFTSDIEYVVRIYENGVSLRKVLTENGEKADISYYLKSQQYKQPRVYGHQTEKPQELIEKYIILASDVNDLVVDPFSGSGTTLAASKKLKRNYIGFEINETYYKIIKERLKKY